MHSWPGLSTSILDNIWQKKSGFPLNVHQLEFRYEGIPRFCYVCGFVTHGRQDCPRVLASASGSSTQHPQQQQQIQQGFGAWLRTEALSKPGMGFGIRWKGKNSATPKTKLQKEEEEAVDNQTTEAAGRKPTEVDVNTVRDLVAQLPLVSAETVKGKNKVDDNMPLIPVNPFDEFIPSDRKYRKFISKGIQQRTIKAKRQLFINEGSSSKGGGSAVLAIKENGESSEECERSSKRSKGIEKEEEEDKEGEEEEGESGLPLEDEDYGIDNFGNVSTIGGEIELGDEDMASETEMSPRQE